MTQKKAVIIGAGPAGLTAAYELIKHTDIQPIILEGTDEIGGISRTVKYNGNRIDIGGHRFFSKSDTVMAWWQNIMPIQGQPAKDDIAKGRDIPLSKEPDAPDPEKEDKVLLFRGRLSRIFFLRKFFSYPISLSGQTISNLGLARLFRICMSYLKIRISPIKNEKSLEDFFINRFGNELYLTFFKDYTQKVWGVPCTDIKPEWGAQRIKGLSISKTIAHAVKKIFGKDQSISQKGTETSLIEQFLYPKLGPGQLWEIVADMVQKDGAELHMNKLATAVHLSNSNATSVTYKDRLSGEETTIEADYVFSTMPMKELFNSFQGTEVPENTMKIANGLMYRDFITVGLLLDKLKVTSDGDKFVPDNWIYIQERDVKLGRLQIFNNWSPYMIKDPNKVWIGLEYFCNEGDELWSMDEETFKKFAIDELAKIDIINKEDVEDSVVIKVPKAYPAYFGTYDYIDELKEYVNGISNLFLIGRNGMHKYNNQDHSMLSAIQAVQNIKNGVTSKDNLWKVNAEQEYHESK